MLPISTKDVIRFTPIVDQIDTLKRLRDEADTEETREAFDKLIAAAEEQRDSDPQPVYLLAVASMLQRAAFRRDLLSAGATYPGDALLYAALREDLKTIAPVNLDDLLETVDAVEAAQEGEVDPDALSRLSDIVRIARSLCGRYAAMEGDREFWMSVAPIIACRHFLIGWEGVDAPFSRRGNITSDETLSQIDESEMRSIGFKIMGLMRPTKAQEKNSASPSRSASNRKPTPTAKKLLTAPGGNSSESVSEETPDAA